MLQQFCASTLCYCRGSGWHGARPAAEVPLLGEIAGVYTWFGSSHFGSSKSFEGVLYLNFVGYCIILALCITVSACSYFEEYDIEAYSHFSFITVSTGSYLCENDSEAQYLRSLHFRFFMEANLRPDLPQRHVSPYSYQYDDVSEAHSHFVVLEGEVVWFLSGHGD